jgi:CheY-like chemotaxis protein
MSDRSDGAPSTFGASSGLRILIVEDHAESAKGLQRLLRLLGHVVRVESDGLAAVRAAEAFAPTAALIDLSLPSLDGFGVAERLRTLPATRDCLLIAMTGWATEEHAQRARAAGFDVHLVKPLSVDVLTNALSAAGV